MKVGYRIYPHWFSDSYVGKPMRELAEHSAAMMERQVLKVEHVGDGRDALGFYQNYDVTYSSTDEMKKGA